MKQSRGIENANFSVQVVKWTENFSRLSRFLYNFYRETKLSLAPIAIQPDLSKSLKIVEKKTSQNNRSQTQHQNKINLTVVQGRIQNYPMGGAKFQN